MNILNMLEPAYKREKAELRSSPKHKKGKSEYADECLSALTCVFMCGRVPVSAFQSGHILVLVHVYMFLCVLLCMPVCV